MARTRRAPRGGFKSFPKRASLWIPFEVSQTLATAGTVVASTDLLGNYFAQTGEEVPVGSTLGPIIWTMGMRPLVPATFSLNVRVEMVMQLEKEGGRATLPLPGVDIVDAPWYGQAVYDAIPAEISSGVFNGPAIERSFRTNAMRKVTGNGQILRIFAVSQTNTDYVLDHIGHVFMKLP